MIADVRFQPTGKLYCFDASSQQDVQPGDYVLVETARGQQLGEVIGVRPPTQREKEESALKPIKRRATGADLALRAQWREKEDTALSSARATAADMNLPIKIIRAEFTFDGKRLTLLYVSEEKRKFSPGELRQCLHRQFGTRVDLLRIGPRDHAKVVGGYGACGELRCCSRFLSNFNPVSIKMAKTQGVSLSPSEITGLCGRLRCCLAFEHEQYREASAMMPRIRKRVQTPHGEGKVVALLPLKGMVVVQVRDRRVEVPVDEVEPIS